MSLNLAERLKQLNEEERLAGLKLVPDTKYKGQIVSAVLDSKDLYKVAVTFKITEGELNGKVINKTYIIDQNTKNEWQGKLGLKALAELMNSCQLAFGTEEELAVALVKLKSMEGLVVSVTYADNKKDPEKPYANYKIVKEA